MCKSCNNGLNARLNMLQYPVESVLLSIQHWEDMHEWYIAVYWEYKLLTLLHLKVKILIEIPWFMTE